MAAVHRHEVDVGVHEQVGFHGSAAELDLLTLIGGPDEDDVVRVLGVEVAQPVRPEGAEDPFAHHPPDLALRHASVQRIGDDELDVVNAGLGRQGEHALDDELAGIGCAHRR